MQNSNLRRRRRSSNSKATSTENAQNSTTADNFEKIMIKLDKIPNSADAIEKYQIIIKNFVNFLFKNNIEKKEMKSIVLKFTQLQNRLSFLFESITKWIKDENLSDENSKWNLLKFIAGLGIDKRSDEFEESMETLWLEMFTRISFSPKMLRFIVPHFVENVMDKLPNSELFVDFLFKIFENGNYLAVLSLAGILKLILNRNFEYPNFYQDVYKLIQPNVCYSDYAQKFFDLIDLVMTSKHLPLYIIAAFVKRLCRTLLFAPLHCQIPIIQLTKNILSRHPLIHSMLINRQEPNTLDADPYDEFETDLQKCQATESSLWELKAIQCHWHTKVASKANFTNSQVQDEESSLGWRTLDEQFDEICERSKKKLETISRISKMGEYSGLYAEEEESIGEYGEEPAAKRKRRSEKETLIRDQLEENFCFFRQ